MHLPYLGDFRITKLYGTPPPAGFTYAAGKHAGIDLVGVADKQVRAISGGTVFRAAMDYDGWGKYVVVKQPDGIYAIYCHLAKAFKSAGQVVQAGEWIGNEGTTGMVTGQHLHLELRRDYSDRYSTIDPAEYLGLENRLGLARAVSELEKQLQIVLNGREKTVNAIEKDGYNYVKLQDLRDNKIVIGYENGKPTVTAK